MKKLLPVIILVSIALVIGCGAKQVDKGEEITTNTGYTSDAEKESEETHFMKCVEKGDDYEIWQDTRTGVEYLRFLGTRGESVTVMYNPNGEPFNDVQEADEP